MGKRSAVAGENSTAGRVCGQQQIAHCLLILVAERVCTALRITRVQAGAADSCLRAICSHCDIGSWIHKEARDLQDNKPTQIRNCIRA